MYPNKLPLTQISNEELGRLIGQQDVIQYILTLFYLNEDEDIKDK